MTRKYVRYLPGIGFAETIILEFDRHHRQPEEES
jgi:hypothetical protein